MDKLNNDTKVEIDYLIGEENSLINLTTDLNTKVFAYITILTNSIQDMKACVTKSKGTMADLIKGANGSLCDKFGSIAKILEGISSGGLPEAGRTLENDFGPPRDLDQELEEYENPEKGDVDLEIGDAVGGEGSEGLEAKGETISEDPIGKITKNLYSYFLELNAARDSKKEEWELLKRTDAMKHLNEIKVGVGISRSQLLNISDFLDEMTTDCLHFINTKRNYLKNSDTEIVNYYKHIQSFSAAYDGLKQKLNAESDESKFFKLLIENFSTKMTFIVKNFLLIFDIYSKGLKRRPKLGEIVLNVRQRISNSWNTIVNVENDVRKLKSEL